MNTRLVWVGVAAVAILILAGVGFAYAPSQSTPVEVSLVDATSSPETPEVPSKVPEEEQVPKRDTGRLSVSVSGDTAPASVSIVGPASVMARIEQCVFTRGWFGAGGNGLSVDWGDGNREPGWRDTMQGKSCADLVRTHKYEIPGTYLIHVRLWHPGPTDAPVTDWEDTITITVK